MREVRKKRYEILRELRCAHCCRHLPLCGEIVDEIRIREGSSLKYGIAIRKMLAVQRTFQL